MHYQRLAKLTLITQITPNFKVNGSCLLLVSKTDALFESITLNAAKQCDIGCYYYCIERGSFKRAY